MDNITATIQSSFRYWADPVVLLQLATIVIAVFLGLAVARVARRWHRGPGRPLWAATWPGLVVEGLVMQVGFVTALVLMLAGHGGLSLRELPTSLVDTALQLIGAAIFARLGVFLLRLLLGEHRLGRVWERRLTLTIWLLIAFGVVGWLDKLEGFLDAIDLMPGKTQFSLWMLLKGLIIISGFVLISTVVARAIERRVLALDNVAISARIGITKFAYFFLVSLGILLGINAAGVDLTALTILTGAIGLGLGFGLQSIASNFVSGFVLLLDKSIKPGDVISFTGHSGTSTENFGWVQELRGRYFVIRDRDGVETLVPNQHLITNPVINWSYSDRHVRLKLPVRISYRDDPELALETLLRATAGHPRVLQDPGPVSRLLEFTESGMNLELRFWIADPENGVNNVRSDVNRAIWRLFRSTGITIPVAQREVFLQGNGSRPDGT